MVQGISTKIPETSCRQICFKENGTRIWRILQTLQKSRCSVELPPNPSQAHWVPQFVAPNFIAGSKPWEQNAGSGASLADLRFSADNRVDFIKERISCDRRPYGTGVDTIYNNEAYFNLIRDRERVRMFPSEEKVKHNEGAVQEKSRPQVTHHSRRLASGFFL